MLLNLLLAWQDNGPEADLLRIKRRGPFAEEIPPEVNTIDLPLRNSWGNVIALARYFRRYPQRPLLAIKERAGQTALVARMLARTNNRIVIRLGTNLSTALKDKSGLRRWLRFGTSRMLYPMADRIVAVSRGVAEDVARFSRLPADRIRVIPNPVLWPGIQEAAREPVEHPWLDGECHPVLVAAGRLTPQKDFSTLIRALARIREHRKVRLIILGEGRQRVELEALIRHLGLEGAVDMPGFVSNPYRFIGRADAFVLSSAWEGSPNVLTEALSLGVPVVSTNCPSGPGEILQEGAIAPLAEVGDHEDLARATFQVLDEPPPAEQLRNAVVDYSAEKSAKLYLNTLFPD